ncbi:MAG: DUF1538 domain-containing protein [Spirochaetaceae bacterium]|jgi:hypothetical protein|nr:DUF1538 domain-containing protein [Spirochaetaceae bacterium]
MNLLEKLKETVMSVAPIMVIVLILGLTAAPIGGALIAQFLIGGVLLIGGLTVFLLGVELGTQPIGEEVGAALTRRRNLPLLLVVAFVTGFFVTVAEPDVEVLADQLWNVNRGVNKDMLVVMIALGVGLLVSVGLLRTVLKLPYNVILIVLYGVTFALAAKAPGEFLAVGFDAGGATTGPMTVPFIMALGVGVAAVRQGSNDSFGLTGIASIGPIAMVLLFGILAGPGSGTQGAAEAVEDTADLGLFIRLAPEVFKEVLGALTPMAVLFAVFQFTLLKLPPRRLLRVVTGLVYSFIGLNVFFLGAKGGFVPTGTRLGEALGRFTLSGGPWAEALVVAVGALFGAVVVCAEPAIWVLTKEVEAVSGGAIKRKVLLVTLMMGVASAIALSMVRVLQGFSLWYYLVPGYALALALTLFCPRLFTAIAFDSGGVASGPMTSTFILAFTLGISSARGGNPVTDAFGVIALVAMIPLIAIQLLGLLYRQGQGRVSP